MIGTAVVSAPRASASRIQGLDRVDAILTDLDGTLVDSHAVTLRVVDRWLASIPGAHHGLDELVLGQPSAAIALHAAPHLGPKAAQRHGDALDDQLAAAAGTTALPGAETLLTHACVPVVIVTSSTRRLAEARLRSSGLSLPVSMVCADDVREGKPAPEAYTRAAALVGLDVRRCVAIEDTAVGVQAARAAGVAVLAVLTTTPAADLEDADLITEDLPAVLPWLAARGAMGRY